MKNNKNNNNMKKGFMFITALLFSTFCIAQTGQTLDPGQSMTIDVKGNIVTSATFNQQNIEGKIMKDQPVSDIKDIKYNPDGTLKIPGYTPTGDPETDQELYKKAKHLLYQNDIEEYNRIFNQPELRPTRKNIPYEEFETYPEHKRQHILSNPDKYIVVFPTENDCK